LSSTGIARGDDLHQVLRREALLRGDRIDDRNWAFDRQLIVDPDLLCELPVQRVDEAFAAVDAAAGKQPVLPPRLLVTAEEHAPLPLQDRRDPDARLRSLHVADDPKPRTPRSLEGSYSTSTRSTSGTVNTGN